MMQGWFPMGHIGQVLAVTLVKASAGITTILGDYVPMRQEKCACMIVRCPNAVFMSWHLVW